MDVVVVGDGKVGSAITVQLAHEGHNVTVIDNRRDTLNDTMSQYDVICVEGNGVSYFVQTKAGVQKADLLIAATSSDEVNILCCMVAKKLGAKHTIARVRDPEYQQQMIFLKDELGLSMAVNPEQAAASDISRMLRFLPAIKVEPFARGRAEMVEFKVRDDSPLAGMPLSDLYRRYQLRILVSVVQRGDEVVIPNGSFVVNPGDKLTVLAAPADITRFFRAIGSTALSAKDATIVGGGRIAYYLAKQLIESGLHVKIIEKDLARCNTLCDLLPKAVIINGDGTDHELLHEEGLDNTDSLIALTGIDEENIILAMYAKNHKVDKVIAKVNNAGLVDMLETCGLDSFISPKDITASRIVSYVRARDNAAGSHVETLYRMADDRVEALEFNVREGARCTGVPLKDMPIRTNVLIAAIIRRNVCIIPSGSDTIEAGDSVVIVTTVQGLHELDSILKEA